GRAAAPPASRRARWPADRAGGSPPPQASLLTLILAYPASGHNGRRRAAARTARSSRLPADRDHLQVLRGHRDRRSWFPVVLAGERHQVVVGVLGGPLSPRPGSP